MSSSSSAKGPKAAMQERLAALRQRRKEARQANSEEVAEEDRRAKLPLNFEQRKERAEWELEEQRKRKAAEEAGVDYDRIKHSQMTAAEAEARQKRRKRNGGGKDDQVIDFEGQTFRKYERMTKGIKPDQVALRRAKEQQGDDYSADTLSYGQSAPDQKDIDNLVEDIEKDIAKKRKWSRRRAIFAESDIDYINSSNMKYNRQLEKHYGAYTQEIKDSFERGTAL